MYFNCFTCYNSSWLLAAIDNWWQFLHFQCSYCEQKSEKILRSNKTTPELHRRISPEEHSEWRDQVAGLTEFHLKPVIHVLDDIEFFLDHYHQLMISFHLLIDDELNLQELAPKHYETIRLQFRTFLTQVYGNLFRILKKLCEKLIELARALIVLHISYSDHSPNRQCYIVLQWEGLAKLQSSLEIFRSME